MSEKTPKWPGDHSEKHSAAAKLGWRRRKYKAALQKKASKETFGGGHHTEKAGPSKLQGLHHHFKEAREEYDHAAKRATMPGEVAYSAWSRTAEKKRAELQELARQIKAEGGSPPAVPPFRRFDIERKQNRRRA